MNVNNFLKKHFEFIKKSDFIYNLYKQIFKRKYLLAEKNTLQTLKSLESMNDSELKIIQDNLLSEILKYAYENTKYYKKIFDEYSVQQLNDFDLKRIPILTKSLIRANLTELSSKEFAADSLGKMNTGGSTGEPLEFYTNELAGAMDNAHHWYLYSLMGYEKGDMILDSGGVTISDRLREKNIFWVKGNKDSVWGEWCMSVLYVDDFNINHYVKKLLSLKPAILRGYPSFFDKLATYMIKNNITLDFKIKGINLTAEVCTTLQRRNIEKAFSSMVYFEYGHSEVSVYCYTCDNTYLYKSSPIYGYVEVLRENGSVADIGEIGNIIVTGFINQGMPFIRYDTGDLGEIVYRHSGIVHFSNIIGRSQDFLWSKNKQKVFLTALVFGQHLKAFKNMNKWQLVQDEIGKVVIKIVKTEYYSDEDEKEILSKFKSVAAFDLEFEYVPNILLTKSGKHLFLIQNIKDSL